MASDGHEGLGHLAKRLLADDEFGRDRLTPARASRNDGQVAARLGPRPASMVAAPLRQPSGPTSRTVSCAMAGSGLRTVTRTRTD